MGRLVVEISQPLQKGVLEVYADINFLHFAIILFVICSAVLVVVSLLTPPPEEEKVAGLTFATQEPATAQESDRRWRRTDLKLSLLLLVCVGLVWIYFS